MIRFFKRLFLFSVPIIVFFSVPLFVLFPSGELTSNTTMLEEHIENKQSLIGLAYSNPVTFLKLHAAKQKTPEILALGTSRIMQVRDFFFKNSSSFYNAGGGIFRINYLRYFTSEVIKSAKPRMIIVCLDQNFFNPNWDNLSKTKFDDEYKDEYNALSYIFNNATTCWHDAFEGKVPADYCLNLKPGQIGLTAAVKKNGFRSDGSYYSGQIKSHPEEDQDYQFKNTLDRIAKATKRFEYAQQINSRAVNELDSFLTFCKVNNIHVVSFLPPYANKILSVMRSKGNDYAYLDKIMPALKPVFEKHRLNVFDFTDLSTIQAGDEEVLDGFHGSEKIYLRMMIQMANKDSILAKSCDVPALQHLLNQSYSHQFIHNETY